MTFIYIAIAWAIGVIVSMVLLVKTPHSVEVPASNAELGGDIVIGSLIWPICLMISIFSFIEKTATRGLVGLANASKYRIKCPSCSGKPQAEGIGGRIAMCNGCGGNGSIIVDAEGLRAHGLIEEKKKRTYENIWPD